VAVTPNPAIEKLLSVAVVPIPVAAKTNEPVILIGSFLFVLFPIKLKFVLYLNFYNLSYLL
jgi:hypothetical protein